MSQNIREARSTIPADKKKSAMWTLAKLMRPYAWTIAVCCALGITLNLAQLINPVIMKTAVDKFMTLYAGKGKEAAAAANSGLWLFSTLEGMGVSFFLVTLLGAAANYAQTVLMTRVCQTILHDLRMRTFDHIHRMKLAAMDEMGSGRLLTRATNDIEALDEFYGDILLGLFKDIFLLIGIVGFMLWMNWRLALVAFAVVPIIAAITFACRSALRRNFVKMKALIGQINGFIAESLTGIRIIQAFNREKEKYEELRELNLAYRKTTMFQVLMNSFMRPAMEVINSIGIALVLVVGFKMIGWEVRPLEIGVLVAFNTYIKKFFEPINDLAEKYNTIQSSLVSADRIFSLLEDNKDLERPEAPGYAEPIRGEIEFRDVWFAYVDDQYALRGLSFKCGVGDKIAFVGSTGAGKTTIISLLSRFYTPQKGEILIDGVPLQEWNLASLRAQIGVVLQDVFLFVGTIEENVRIHAEISSEQVARATKLAQADGFIDSLPGGMQHIVSERGATFSTGERQLISFARAIAHDPRILVLDEATANIDSNTEERIQRSIQAISRGRTSIFIAHRLSTIRACDVIYYLESGTIAEAGTHDSLMELNGKYRALVEEQG